MTNLTPVIQVVQFSDFLMLINLLFLFFPYIFPATNPILI